MAFTAACLVAALVVPPVAQPLSYHQFADDRTFFGIARFWDVASNIAFLLAGLLGLGIVAARPAAFASRVEAWPYVVFFAGLALTCLGSAYYHLMPGNARLVWDRLPITMALAGLLLSQVGDRISVRIESDHSALKGLEADTEGVCVKAQDGGAQKLGLTILKMK